MVRLNRRNAIFALLLLVPAPTIGTLAGMVIPGLAGTPVGQGIYFASKAWLLIVPLWWWLSIERRRIGRVRAPGRRWGGGLLVGAGLGVAIAAVIFLAHLLIGRHLIDIASFREAASESGLADPVAFLVLAAYICTVNALLEEIVWRWFVFRRCEELLPAGHGRVAVILAATFFTLHHVIALGVQLDPVATILASVGVFVGGVVWSGLYLRYRTIWPSYVSHAIVDVAIFALGWSLLFW